MSNGQTNVKIKIEVAFALPHQQKIIELLVEQGTVAEQAVVLSEMHKLFPDERIVGADLGVFGECVDPQYELQEGDRVEIYRTLLAEPKEVRKRRAAASTARRLQAKHK